MTAPYEDPLAGYSPDWRKRLADPLSDADPQDDPLAGYTPNWRQTTAVASAMFGAPEPKGIPDQPGFFHPGLQESGNIDLTKRPTVQNPDGSVSTVKSFSINEDGREILLPQVSDDGRMMTEDDAVGQYHQTGRHLGMFDTPEEATAYA